MNTPSVLSTSHRSYTDEFKHNAIQQLNSGNSLRTVSACLGISKNSLLRWKSQIQPETLVLTAPLVNPDSLSDSLPQQALALLSSGRSVVDVAALLNVSNRRIHQWRNEQTQLGHPSTDKRRLYDEAFRQEALQQIRRGVSVRKLSQTLGVTQMTLHKWKREQLHEKDCTIMDELPRTGTRKSAPSGADTVSEESVSSHSIASLLEQLRIVEAERDVLKKAFVILLRAEDLV